MNAPLDKNMIDQILVNIEAILGVKLIDLERKASGALINSFQHKINIANEFDLQCQIIGLDYWKIVEYGVNPAAIPYDPSIRTNAASSLYIQGLMNWIKTKGIASENKVVKQIAFMIARKQTAKGGGGARGNPINKNKLGFIRKTQKDREKEVQKIGEVYQKSVFTMVKSLTGSVEIVI
tara:strand:+ start:8908 stop:9444 length:537 start_codon:yes stop_codon:yes gene_type:complete